MGGGGKIWGLREFKDQCSCSGSLSKLGEILSGGHPEALHGDDNSCLD